MDLIRKGIKKHQMLFKEKKKCIIVAAGLKSYPILPMYWNSIHY